MIASSSTLNETNGIFNVKWPCKLGLKYPDVGSKDGYAKNYLTIGPRELDSENLLVVALGVEDEAGGPMLSKLVAGLLAVVDPPVALKRSRSKFKLSEEIREIQK